MFKLLKWLVRIVLLLIIVFIVVWFFQDAKGKYQMEQFAENASKEIMTFMLEQIGEAVSPDPSVSYQCPKIKYGKRIMETKICPAGTPYSVCCNR